MCIVYAVANQKGGCSKTSVTVNLGVGLAMEGKRVLVIDADPQGSLTISLGYPDPDEIPLTLATVMTDIINENDFDEEYGLLHHQEGIDLLPANMDLSGIEVSLANAMSREMILKEYIEMVRDRYDFILIDCMPSLGVMTINALVAADRVLIPVQSSYLPVKGLQMLTMVDYRTNYAKDITVMLRESYGMNDEIGVLQTFIPFSVKIQEASSEGISIFRYAPKCKAAESFASLTKEVLEHEH